MMLDRSAYAKRLGRSNQTGIHLRNQSVIRSLKRARSPPTSMKNRNAADSIFEAITAFLIAGMVVLTLLQVVTRYACMPASSGPRSSRGWTSST